MKQSGCTIATTAEQEWTVNDMDIKKKKIELLGALVELEEDIKVLRKNVVKAMEDLPKVETLEDVIEFGKNHDLEEGLKHIQLF